VVKYESGDLKKLKQSTPRESDLKPGERVLAIVRVRQPGYVPSEIHLRSRIDDEMFTADFPAERLAGLRADPQVASVELNQRLQQID
jgi:hypothetical protein